MSQRKRLKTKGARGEESDKYIKWANEDVREEIAIEYETVTVRKEEEREQAEGEREKRKC